MNLKNTFNGLSKKQKIGAAAGVGTALVLDTVFLGFGFWTALVLPAVAGVAGAQIAEKKLKI